ncbi:urotensin-2 [Desmodus rotundus]|uniref:urotensin-2 n=1 Tax=Desmodus rotundus TaxID=9430 RepID=UPI0039E2A408
MYKLASCCLLLVGCLNSLFSLPVPDSRDGPLQFPGKMNFLPFHYSSLLCTAQDGGRLTLDEGDRASLLHGLLEVFGAETGDGLRKTGKGILVGRGCLILWLLDLLCSLTSQMARTTGRAPLEPAPWAPSAIRSWRTGGRTDVLTLVPFSCGSLTPLTTQLFASVWLWFFQVFSGQGPNVLLNHLLARIRKYNKRGHPSECFWKYCV